MEQITKWGELELNIYERSYQFASASTSFNEITLIPSPDKSRGADSALQQGPRTRKRITFKGGVTSIDDYNSLLEDHLKGIVKTFIGYDNVPFESLIEHLSPPTWKNTFWDYDITLLEV